LASDEEEGGEEEEGEEEEEERERRACCMGLRKATIPLSLSSSHTHLPTMLQSAKKRQSFLMFDLKEQDFHHSGVSLWQTK